MKQVKVSSVLALLGVAVLAIGQCAAAGSVKFYENTNQSGDSDTAKKATGDFSTDEMAAVVLRGESECATSLMVLCPRKAPVETARTWWVSSYRISIPVSTLQTLQELARSKLMLLFNFNIRTAAVA